MPMPKKKHSNVRQGKRRFSNYRLASVKPGRCPDCGAPALPHRACPACGAYKGRSVKKKREKKAKSGRGQDLPAGRQGKNK